MNGRENRPIASSLALFVCVIFLSTYSSPIYAPAENADRSPDRIPGAGPTIGFALNHLETLPGGQYLMVFYTVYRGAGVVIWREKFTMMLKNPLKVELMN